MSDKEAGDLAETGGQGVPPLPEPDVEQGSRWLPSLVWLIPLLAALIGAGLAAKSILDQGPPVTVSFKSAEGLEPGKTKVKYKDVDIGQVRAITLGEDLSKVLVTIDMSKEARRFATADSRFWVVRPQIGASGVTGLGTLLSGATSASTRASRKPKRRTSSAWKIRPPWRATRRASCTPCMRTASAPSTWARPCSSTACAWARWSASRWTRMATASPCRSS